MCADVLIMVTLGCPFFLPKSYFILCVFNFFKCLYILERDRQSMGGEGAEREKTQNMKQAPGSELSA